MPVKDRIGYIAVLMAWYAQDVVERFAVPW